MKMFKMYENESLKSSFPQISIKNVWANNVF